MKAILVFRLPEERTEHDAAVLGRDALMALWQIDERCRGLLKHDYMANEDVRQFAEEIRDMIDAKFLES